MIEGSVPSPTAPTGGESTAIALEGGTVLSSADLDEVVGRRAGAVRAAGVSAGDRVGVCRSGRLETVVDLLAVIRAGAIGAVLDADGGSVDAAVGSAGIEHVLVDRTSAPVAPDHVDTIDVANHLEDATPMAATLVSPGRPVTISFTSGTTGDRTPVRHTAWNHAAAAIAAVDRLGIRPGDRWYDPLALHHMGGLAPVTRCLAADLPMVLSDVTAPDDLARRIAAVEGTIVSVVPTMLHRLVADDAAVPAGLRCLLVGGAALSRGLYRRAREAGWPVYASYGLTETLGQVCTATPSQRDAHPGTVGRPLAGVSIAIDGSDERPKDGGRLHVASPSLSAECATGELDGTPAIETADVGHHDDAGRVWVHGRVDDAIQTGGELVWPDVVAGALEEHPAVAEAAVVGRPDPEWGERVEAAVVLTHQVDVDSIRAVCRERLPAAAVPKAIHVREAIPRTVSGTVDRPALRRELPDAE